MDKPIVFNIIEETLINNGIDSEDAEELADSIVEKLDENGFFEEESSPYDGNLYD